MIDGEDLLERGVTAVTGKKKGKVKAHTSRAIRHARSYDWRWDPEALARHQAEEDLETGKVTWAAAQKAKKVRDS